MSPGNNVNSQRSRDELEFLPAAIEIQETPPSPTGRAITWSIVLLFTIAVTWACIGEIDIVVVAQGKVVPSERIKQIQPLEIGTISAIRVFEGQKVRKGEVLIELDTTSTSADATRLVNDHSTAQTEIARTSALVAAMQTEVAPQPRWPTTAHAELVQRQQQLLTSQWQQYQAKLSALDSEQTRREAELAATQETIIKHEKTLPIVSERAESLKLLADQQFASRHTYLEIEQQRIETEQDLAGQRQTRQQLLAILAQMKEQRLVEEKEALTRALGELNDAKQRGQGLNQENIKAQQRNQLQHLVSPVDGVVQQLAVHTVGGVVTPAQQLMIIVPQEENVEVEAVIENKDIGFVREDQSAEVKVDAFPFTRYGVLDAKLLSISNDAVADEKRGLIFTARVLLETATIKVDGKLIRLSPGMSVTVEVKTGTRRLIEYVLSPLLRYADESVRER